MNSPAQSDWQNPPAQLIAERYKILRRLGAGGMGEAFLAEDSLLHRQVVLKRMSPQVTSSGTDRQRFLSEAKRAAAINNPHVVQIYDAIESSGELLLILEYVNGASLRSLRGKLDIERFFDIALQIANGLAAAHTAHVIHCDLKPDNVLISSGGTVKVLDFGLARLAANATEATVSRAEQKFAGTPGYMAPEMIKEQAIDERADIFALGVIFYELLTGISPFHCSTLLDTLHKTVHDDPQPVTEKNASLPAELDWIVSKMLAKAREERYSSVHDVITDLTACQRRMQSGTRTHITLPSMQTKTPWSRYVVLGVLATALGAGAYFGLRQKPDAKQQPAVRYRSVAVLPFQIIGGGQDGLRARADGIAAMLTSKLARIAEAHQLQITPSSEVRRLSLTSPAAAKQQLGADLVIEGQFQKKGDQVLVTYDVVDTHTMRQLNSRDFQSKLDDSFRLEEQTVSGALELLAIQLEAAERQSLGQHGTESAAAYDLFLTGDGYMREFEEAGNVDRAIESFRQALVQDANYAQAEAALGRAYWRKYQLTHDATLVPQARSACEAAVKKSASLADSHLCLGIVAGGTGEYEVAVKELETAVQAEPSNDVALRELARIYERMKRPADAEQVYQRGIAAQPHYWAGYDWLGAFYARQARYDDAAAQFRLAIEQAPGNAQLYSGIGGIYILQGKNREAVDALRKAVELRPNADGYQNLGQAYVHQRNFDEAVNAFKQALTLDDKNYILYSVLGDAYLWTQSHHEDAVTAYKRSNELALEQRKVNPRDAAANTFLAINSAGLGDELQALDALKRAQKDNPHDAETMFFAARVYARLKRANDAASWLDQAIANGYSKADIRACPDLDGVMGDAKVRAAIAK
jgi:tetratricopeptide (TPR) repeat protein